MRFLWIDSRDTPYNDWLALRHRILREPLGLSFTLEDLAEERDHRHLIAVADETVFGGLTVICLDETSWKIRQVAVDEKLRGSGLGRDLMLRMETEAREKAVTRLVLNSREEVVPFYEKLGYDGVGDVFIEVGIPHRKMVRDLTRGEREKKIRIEKKVPLRRSTITCAKPFPKVGMKD